MAPCLALCKEKSAQRDYPLRAAFNALRYIERSGGQWRYMPNDLPPWTMVYQQTQRWIRAGCFEMMVEDLPMLLREPPGAKDMPSSQRRMPAAARPKRAEGRLQSKGRGLFIRTYL